MRSAALLAAATALFAGAAPAATLSTLTSWNGSTGYIWGRPFVAPNGTIYGVLSNGGSGATGSVWSLTPNGNGGFTPATIASFTGGANGASPTGGLTMDPAADSQGDLYGAAATGGTSGTCVYTWPGCGVIYRLTPPANGNSWTETVIYTFKGSPDGAYPTGDLVADSTGALYGVTLGGGCTPTLVYASGCGTVFKLTPPQSGNTWTETVLYRFQGGTADGAEPNGRLALDANGNIYGATWFGGTVKCAAYPQVKDYENNPTNPDGGCGVLFKLTKSGGGYTESVLHFFTDGTDGSFPLGGLALNSTGTTLYGTTAQGGNSTPACMQYGQSGCGLMYQVTFKTGKKANLLTFQGSDGGFPTSLLIDAKNKLYGATALNSTADKACASFYCGTAYKFAKVSKVWTESMLHAFGGGNDNGGPNYGMAADSQGNLYGVSLYGSTSTVFSLTGSGYTPGAR